MSVPTKGWFKIRFTKCGALQMDFDGEIYLMDAEDMDLFVKHHPSARKDGYLLSYTLGRSRGNVEAGFFHRLIWEKHNGPIPEGLVIDHINRDPKNNRKANLRCVTQKVNTQNNSRAYEEDYGIYARNRKNGTVVWLAEIKRNGKRYRSYTAYETKEEARQVVKRLLEEANQDAV